MKNLSVILSMTFFLNANCQDISKKLQNKTWFMVGAFFIAEKTIFYKEKPKTESSEVKFLSDNTFHVKMTKAFKIVNLYELKNDTIKVLYTINTYNSNIQKKEERTFYYKIKELPNKKDLEFDPISVPALSNTTE